MRHKSVSRLQVKPTFTIMKYSELREKVERGARFSIDFKKRTLKVNGKLVDPKTVDCDTCGVDIMDAIETFYHAYKHSIPSERSEHRQRNYFKALPYEELNDAELCFGEHRETARFRLEFLILRAIIDGRLTWQPNWGNWFWQSEHDKDLVILREWIEPKTA